MWIDQLRLNLLERDKKQSLNNFYTDNFKILLQQFIQLKQENLTLLKASETPLDSNENIQSAFIQSLQSQLHSYRDELTNFYKSQNIHNLKLLNLNELLRDKDNSLRAIEAENLSLKASVSRLTKAREDDFEGKRERERGIESLQDDLATLKLELDQVELRNQDLKNDNANLLQRWLDRMNDEAQHMNQSLPTNNAGAVSDMSTDDDFTDIDK
ncbi:hypothetical protein J056_001808 [Wallemia ichthyophaga EXF-994]|nr:uncharacterized protein J056_001808 [Wallemia ichthyophaga EXF-994]EOQ99485.1 hypothetical protein J056_001808 [Wallemia ichthyophaga EXF-994]TIA70290.1 hypothetical protein E3P91_03188 [Wallemia ichthyophaga]TIA78030.1 hypothetical protein E3P98_04010 [Wallemia ichthyophaga]TIB07665.1 hypothetical protein E3P90_03982 [Wallemia ichthyophaga]